MYHAEHFEEMNKIISEREEDDAAAIRGSKELLREPDLKQYLAYIAACSEFLIVGAEHRQAGEAAPVS